MVQIKWLGHNGICTKWYWTKWYGQNGMNKNGSFQSSGIAVCTMLPSQLRLCKLRSITLVNLGIYCCLLNLVV